MTRQVLLPAVIYKSKFFGIVVAGYPNGLVAQMVEHLVEAQSVDSSKLSKTICLIQVSHHPLCYDDYGK